MTGILTHTDGNVTMEFYSYMSLRADIVTMALQDAVPEAENFKGEMLRAGWTSFLRVVPNLIGVTFDNESELTEDEQLLKDWSESARDAMQKGDWKQVWENYTLLSYGAITLLARAFTATRRQADGLSDPKIGSSDDDDPELLVADTDSQSAT